ncbi:hypothetical protein B0H14DRAFT_3667909 [Mycena olivaceomarginata]|nr:hypothetical protein B0H14DRAFT_3667909 [Mycena olivaceomarginata]
MSVPPDFVVAGVPWLLLVVHLSCQAGALVSSIGPRVCASTLNVPKWREFCGAGTTPVFFLVTLKDVADTDKFAPNTLVVLEPGRPIRFSCTSMRLHGSLTTFSMRSVFVFLHDTVATESTLRATSRRDLLLTG